ncbi:hypothetical protein NCC78_26380 [Micromonospora phytophila]|uniref:hypothetical protein n=1 Tax=Micromonospora phytophila TaxID=709888 RepID=UPI002030F6C5|nr:hypothetical protein [Micromonospora phytophila]MCM0678176.1 hypothetical protein [Micromonospora phytophila]
MAAPESPERTLLLTLAGTAVGVLPIAVIVIGSASGRGDLGTVLWFLLAGLGIGVVASLALYAQLRARATWDREFPDGRAPWWRRPRP